MTAAGPALPGALALRCSGCARVVTDPWQLACPDAAPGDDIDHVLCPPEPRPELVVNDTSPLEVGATNPFVRYRTFSYSYRLARAQGLSDATFVAIVEELDRAVAGVWGHGFTVTPLRRAQLVADQLSYVKDETRNVGGSHKGRHLMGLAVHLTLLERLGWAGRATGGADPPPLAIASCGNAALAAAVVAAAMGRRLDVFVPPEASATVLEELTKLGATVHPCPRGPGEAGDPCYHRFRAAVRSGAVPFSVQGPSNGLTLEGGATLGYELAEQLGDAAIERVYVQVGGGALAAATYLGMQRAAAAGLAPPRPLPALHPVQTARVAPLSHALAAARALVAASGDAPADVVARLARARHTAMRPWPLMAPSIASGIVDDEVYDWARVVEATLASGGEGVNVEEPTLAEANRLGVEVTGIQADPTGTAGLAGLVADARAGRSAAGTSSVLLFTGIRR